MSLDDALCADGCGRLAETERPTADGAPELVCRDCRDSYGAYLGAILSLMADQRVDPWGDE